MPAHDSFGGLSRGLPHGSSRGRRRLQQPLWFLCDSTTRFLLDVRWVGLALNSNNSSAVAVVADSSEGEDSDIGRIIASLVKIGFRKANARKLVEQYGADEVKAALADMRVALDGGEDIGNQAGWITKSLQEGWDHRIPKEGRHPEWTLKRGEVTTGMTLGYNNPARYREGVKQYAELARRVEAEAEAQRRAAE